MIMPGDGAMSFSRCIGAGLAALVLAGCRGSAPEQFSPLQDEGVWHVADHQDEIIRQSCPQGLGDGFAMSFLVSAEPVALGDETKAAEALTSLDYLGGWAMSGAPGSFGGLSGLKVMESGDLLAISDGGAFVEIGFDQETVLPTGRATLSFLRNAAGEIITGKAEADSEGLELSGDIALVSFERHHRVLAFAYGVCGSNARGIPVSEISGEPASLGSSIGNNSGAEGLALSGGRLVIGLETMIDRLGPLAIIDTEGVPQFAARAWIDGEGLPLVGLDAAGDTLYSLHRAYNPLTGNSIHISATGPDGMTSVLGRISRPLTVDNFEGIAVLDRPDGERRLFIVADDNFSDRQRTLLFAFRIRGTQAG